MKVEIEEYRGWTISFDTDQETFYCYSHPFDQESRKNSFASIKKYIDDFIKDNETFIPIWVEKKPSMFSDNELIQLTGIRKDKLFTYIDKNGQKTQLSKHSEGNYILYDEKNEIYKDEIKKLDESIKELNAQKRQIENKITGISLVEYKKTLGL